MHDKKVNWSCMKEFLSFEECSVDSSSWLTVTESAQYIPVAYTSGWINFQNELQKSRSNTYDSISLVIFNNDAMVAVWSLSIVRKEGEWKIGTNESRIRPPLFDNGVTQGSKKKIIDQCLLAINELCRSMNVNQWQCIDSLKNNGMDSWHNKLMEKGAMCNLGHELYVDLLLDSEQIKANFRKSYRPLVNKGKRLWKRDIYYNDVSNDVFAEFVDLHREVAGCTTRPIETWDLQKQAICSGQAFLITLRDKNERMIGAALFHVSRDECVYAVGAYDRSLFDKPLGHVVQFEAIEQMKRLGLRWYLLGERQYLGDKIKPTDKEISIGYFKEGFATHVFPQIQTSCPVS